MNNPALFLAAAAAAIVAAAPASARSSATPAPTPAQIAAAQAAALAASTLKVGATVYDPKGGVVGTIESLDATAAILATAHAKVRLPNGSFGVGPRGPTLALTAAQIEAAATATPPPPLTLAKGSTVTDPKGQLVGTIEEVSPQFVLVATAKNKVQLPVSAFAAGASGSPMIAMTAVQLDAAADAAKAQAVAQAAAQPQTPAPTTASAKPTN